MGNGYYNKRNEYYNKYNGYYNFNSNKIDISL